MNQADALAQLPFVLDKTDLSNIFADKHAGKVRDSYRCNGARIIVTTDRISAFDFHVGHIPFKGQVLNQLAAFWFDQTRDIIPNHILAVPHPNVTIARDVRPLPVEMVVRGYITGVTSTAMWHQYAAGTRNFCGHDLPEGLRKNDKLPQPLVTPSTKESAKNAHDKSVSPQELMAGIGMDAGLYQRIEDTALALFARGAEIAAKAGYILVDTKYEFGLDDNDQLILIDEIHTPDSSRYWRAADYEMRQAAGDEQDFYDKEFVRLWLAARGLNKFGMEDELKKLPPDLFVEAALRYVAVYEAIAGQVFHYKIGDAKPEIEQAVKAYFEY